MNREAVEKIARAVLYEGYVLYPYRPSVKNRQRWTFGGVLPGEWCERDGGDASVMQTECLVRGGDSARVEVIVRFLQAVERRVGELLRPMESVGEMTEPPYREVEVLAVEGKQYPRWQEAVEREVRVGEFELGALAREAVRSAFGFERERGVEGVRDGDGMVAGILLREREEIAGAVEVCAEKVGAEVFRLTVRVMNVTEGAGLRTREEAVVRGFLSTHTLLGVRDGGFVSLTDPPADCAGAAGGCRNVGAWPVLVGTAPACDTVLSSAIILPDYPEIAAESPGDLFDGTEIDEILTLRILTLTEEEKAAAAGTDERVRRLLERTSSLGAAELGRLHGGLRGRGSFGEVAAWDPFETAGDGFVRLERAQLLDGAWVKIGDKVVLRPGRRADILDLALAGKVATVVGIEQDLEDRVHVAVTVDADPGRDLGAAGKIGHRFFFGLEEIEGAGENVRGGGA